MNEWLIILVMTGCSVLFAAGGTDIPGIGGQKWLRRFGIPVFLSIIAILSHVIWWKVSIMALLLMVGLSAGYGEHSNYWKKLGVFCMFSVPFLILGWSWWVVLTPVLCLGTFVLSNINQTSDMFKWKYVEFIWGYFIAVTFLSCLN